MDRVSIESRGNVPLKRQFTVKTCPNNEKTTPAFISPRLFTSLGAFLGVGVLAFPAGWSDPSVQEVCGPLARQFYPGQCGLRWAYILAVIGVADVLVLAALAFTLAVRHVKLLALQPYPVLYKGNYLSFSITHSLPGLMAFS